VISVDETMSCVHLAYEDTFMRLNLNLSGNRVYTVLSKEVQHSKIRVQQPNHKFYSIPMDC
jgi:hypothetical protein